MHIQIRLSKNDPVMSVAYATSPIPPADIIALRNLLNAPGSPFTAVCVDDVYGKPITDTQIAAIAAVE